MPAAYSRRHRAGRSPKATKLSVRCSFRTLGGIFRKSSGGTANREAGTNREPRLPMAASGQRCRTQTISYHPRCNGRYHPEYPPDRGERRTLPFAVRSGGTKGTYYFYYLPYQVQKGYGFYSGGYLPKENEPDAAWQAQGVSTLKSTRAKVVRVESRQAFDSFYPMEVAATAREKENYINRHKAPLYLFAEDRRFPIRMRSNLPTKWLADKQGKLFRGEAAPNEYYTFQIGLWTAVNQADKIAYRASSLKCGREIIPATAITCFNVEGTDPYGKAFKKEVNVPKGEVQALWFGIDIPDGQKEGIYTGTITLSDAGGAQSSIPLSIRIAGKALPDRGDSELWRCSRLRWLNSTLGIADTPTAPYTAMTVNENRIGCLGRSITIDEGTGLPAQIRSWNNDVLSSPIEFVIQTAGGVKSLKAVPELTERTEGHVAGNWKAEDEDMTVSCKAIMEFDGWINYIYTITPKSRYR